MSEQIDNDLPACSLNDAIRQHRLRLEHLLRESLQPIARRCASHWNEPEQIDKILSGLLGTIPCCQLIYVIDHSGLLYSGNVSHNGIDVRLRGQDLGGRPYLHGFTRGKVFALSDVYISRIERHSCITALHRVCNPAGEPLGYLAADFDLRSLPQLQNAAEVPSLWRQIKGDPAIRQTLFQQQRVASAMDERLNQVNDIINELITARGVFHAKLHYGASRATLWLNKDPRRYRIHVLDEIMDPAVCLAYPRETYPEDAIVNRDQVRLTLDRFVNLRLGDSVIYLRSASLNVINGMVGLNFSCDGTHYLPVPEFLEKDHQFWFGE
jgi:hypothetical protein